MEYTSKSIRAFIGAKDYDSSRTFYTELGFEEVILSDKMSLFKVNDQLGFYLQKAYVKDWVDNSMLFLEVDNLEDYLLKLRNKNLTKKFSNVKLSEIVENDWGKEFFLHDPSGILWHFTKFNY